MRRYTIKLSPYTVSAKNKEIRLAQDHEPSTGPIKLHIVSFTKLQMAIYESYPGVKLTVLMRCYMIKKIAEAIAKREGEGTRDEGRASVRWQAR